MQSVRDVLRQRGAQINGDKQVTDAIRVGCAEAKPLSKMARIRASDAIRAGCSETNGRLLYSNDHAQNNEVNRKESYPIQP